MLSPFASPREVLDRARDNTKELETRIREFFGRNPYARVIESDRSTGEILHKARLTAQLPGKFTAVLKDAISNLRDSLDHTVYASCIALGRTDPETTKFPFADTGRQFEGELWALKEVSPAIWQAIERFRPYQGGNDLLWALNKIRNTKTHRILVPVGHAPAGVQFPVLKAVSIPNAALEMKFCNVWDAAKNEVLYMRLPQGCELEYKVNIAFDVTFGDVPVLAGQPVIGVLSALINECERVLLSIEETCAEILGK